MVLGGFMVDGAYKHLPEGGFFDALCETRACLPDAIQIPDRIFFVNWTCGNPARVFLLVRFSFFALPSGA